MEPHSLAVCGFSAGGHLCGSLCVHCEDIPDNETYKEISNRPDAAVLCYPVITSGEKAHRGSFDALLGEGASAEELEYMSLEMQVTKNTPPCFVWATVSDQAVPVENTLMFLQACREKGVQPYFFGWGAWPVSGRRGLGKLEKAERLYAGTAGKNSGKNKIRGAYHTGGGKKSP